MEVPRIPPALMLLAAAACLLLACPLNAAESDALFNVRLAHHNNIPNAADQSNRFGDRLMQIDYRHDWRFITTPGNWFSSGVLAQVDLHQRTRGMNRAAAGFALGYSHKFGLGPQAPRVSFRSQFLYQHFEGSLRRGLSQSWSLNLSRWLSENVLLSGSWSWSDRAAPLQRALRVNPAFEADVFEQDQQQWSLQTDYLLSNGHALTLSTSFMEGDVAASARPGTPLRQIATAIARDNGIDRNYLAYRVSARTRSAGLQWSIPLTDDSSMSLGSERRLARADAGVRYQETRFFVDYLVRF